MGHFSAAFAGSRPVAVETAFTASPSPFFTFATIPLSAGSFLPSTLSRLVVLGTGAGLEGGPVAPDPFSTGNL